MNGLRVLKRAREILAPVDAWTKRASAKDATGIVCSLYSEEACQFCLTGAMQRAQHEMSLDWDDYVAAVQLLGFEMPKVNDAYTFSPAVIWNDDLRRTHEEVLARIDAGVQAGESKEDACLRK